MKRFFSRRKASEPINVVHSTTVPVQAPLPSARPVSLQPKFTVPPLPHPCPYSTINVLVTTGGLVLRPDLDGIQSTSHVRIRWGLDATVEEVEGDVGTWTATAQVHGIVGFLRLFHACYLLVITSKAEVGNLFDESRKVYKLNGVNAIPLDKTRATAAVNMLATLKRSKASLPMPEIIPDDQASVEDEKFLNPNNEVSRSPHVTFLAAQGNVPSSSLLSPEDADVLQPSSANSSGVSTPTTSFSPSPIAQILENQLSFWTKLSKRTLQPAVVSPELRSPSTETIDSFDGRMANGEGPKEVLQSIMAKTTPAPATPQERHTELDDKIVRETIKEFIKGGMYLSYNFDITTSLQRKQQQLAKIKRQSHLLHDLQAIDEQPRLSLSSEETEVFLEPHATLPLWRRVDRKFWWNEALSRPFIDAGLHSYVLPIMQGYIQIATFQIPATMKVAPQTNDSEPNMPPKDVGHTIDYVIVSRRSRERAGLRYQRRGIDDDANVANFVETETIMRIKREDRSNIFSYIQIRGSIPLFWTQSGYGLKPPPQLSKERTHEQNIDALKRHMMHSVNSYGPLSIVNLAEQHGKEGPITTAYRDSMQEVNLSDAHYYEYDFHAETKGMRYENISKLIEKLERNFETQGFFWVSGSVIMSQQKGAFRVNCIDCLDRTNVVQSAFARFVLQSQLEAVAVQNAYEIGDRSEADIVFNDVWANNGDAISRAYAGTSALKGDFTRTGKRDISGMLNDGLNSLSRVYTSTFSDWFCQAVIDFFLGNRTLSVFSEFLSKLSSTDPGELIRISKIRAAAIETCSSRVLSEGERQIAGWTLLSPVDLNSKLSDKFEEKVLLLTVKALYIVSYDYNLEKVKLFTRVPLGDITGITKGLYILSPLEEASRRLTDNYGFIVSYLPSHLTTRVSSYSVRNTVNDTHTHTSRTGTQTRQPAQVRMQRLLSHGTTTLSKILSNVAAATGTGRSDKIVIAAFKALPIDVVQAKAEKEATDDSVADAANCKEAVELIVATMRKACEDVGSGIVEDFVHEEEIVSLAEAQRMTTMFAKLEYSFKRLLWLGS